MSTKAAEKTAKTLDTFTPPLLRVADVDALPMTRERAEALTATIRKAATTFTNAYVRLRDAIAEAKVGEAHVALGFKSWQAYIADTFADLALPKLAKEERESFIGMLSNEGMSVRAIAAVTGEGKSTVARVVAQVSQGGQADGAGPKTKTVTGLDGKSQTRKVADRKPAKHKSVVNAGVARAAAAVAVFADLTALDDTLTPEAAKEHAEALAQIEAEVHRVAVMLRKRARKAGN